MPWSDNVLGRFTRVPADPNENDYHGPYNKLLSILFPPDSKYTVTPQFLTISSTKAVDILITYEVWLRDRPVFVLELKAPKELEYISSRQRAGDQMRQRLYDLRDACPIPRFHGVGAKGTKLCFYNVASGHEEADVQPLAIPSPPTRVTDTAPFDRWDCDLLEVEGENRLRAVVQEILAACADL